MTGAQRAKVVEVAMKAVDARLRGESTVELGLPKGRQQFILGPVYKDRKLQGYCNRFVRQVFEVALNLEPFDWRYRSDSARETCQKLEDAGKSVPFVCRLPGDILGINRSSGKYGHIAIYLSANIPGHEGKELIAENTSSGARGYPVKPGTKITRLSDVQGRVTGCYRP